MQHNTFGGRSLYRIYDPNPQEQPGCFEVADFDEAMRWNEKHWGIFWTVNQFNGPRKKENCTRILSWAIDLDVGSKVEQKKQITNFGLVPSMLIESARGYHVYWDVDPQAEANESHASVMEDLVTHFGADKNAKDISRILRLPATLHWKDIKNPYAIVLREYSDAVYTPGQMIQVLDGFKKKLATNYRDDLKIMSQKNELKTALVFQSDKDLFERIYNLDCELVLSRLSGTQAVCFETYTFKRQGNGKTNILVNGKSTSCWIDSHKRIGSSDKGGPTIWQWVNWFHKDHKKTYELLKQHIPEVFNV
jgi:hypothetical protein